MSKKTKSLVEQALDDPDGFDYTAALIKLGIDESDELTIAFCAGVRHGRKWAKWEKDQEKKVEISDAYRFGMEDSERRTKICASLNWVGLTDKERRKLYKCHTWMEYAKAIEEALKEKNT